MFPLNQSIETSKETCVNYATGAPPNMGALFPAKSCRTESIAGVASGKGQHRTCHLRTFLGVEFKWEQPRKKTAKSMESIFWTKPWFETNGTSKWINNLMFNMILSNHQWTTPFTGLPRFQTRPSGVTPIELHQNAARNSQGQRLSFNATVTLGMKKKPGSIISYPLAIKPSNRKSPFF